MARIIQTPDVFDAVLNDEGKKIKINWRRLIWGFLIFCLAVEINSRKNKHQVHVDPTTIHTVQAVEEKLQTHLGMCTSVIAVVRFVVIHV